MGRRGSTSLPALNVDPAGSREEKGLSPKLCWAERGFLAGKLKIVSLLRRGCRRDLIQSAAKYLGGRRTDPAPRGFAEVSPDLGRTAAVAAPADNPVTPGHLIVPKVPEEPGWLARGHPTPAELGSSHVSPWPPLVCSRGSAQGTEMAAGQGVFPASHGLAHATGDIWKPRGRLCCPCGAGPLTGKAILCGAAAACTGQHPAAAAQAGKAPGDQKGRALARGTLGPTAHVRC